MSFDDNHPPKEAPDCTTCTDQGFVPDLTGETGTANCPDCNPRTPTRSEPEGDPHDHVDAAR